MNARARKISATIAGMALVVAGLSACETDDPDPDPNDGTNPVSETTVPAGPSSTAAMVDPTTTLAG